MLKSINYILFPLILIGCESSNPGTLYTIISVHPKANGTIDYFMVSKDERKLIINKSSPYLWKTGEKIYIEGEIPSSIEN